MHFQNLEPDKDNGKRAIIKLMRDSLAVTKYTKKMKVSKSAMGKS